MNLCSPQTPGSCESCHVCGTKNMISYTSSKPRSKLPPIYACKIHGLKSTIECIEILNEMKDFEATGKKVYFFTTLYNMRTCRPYINEFATIFDIFHQGRGIRLMKKIDYERRLCTIQ